MADQAEQHQNWQQEIKKHRVAIGVVAIVLVVVIVFIIIGYWFDWTGFNGYNKVTITHTISGTNAGTVTRTEEYQLGKGLWDWLQLLGILAIPAVVGLGTVWFTLRQTEASEANRAQQAKESEANREKRHKTDLEIADKNRELQQETDLQIAADNQQEAALQTYIDKITESLIKYDLAMGSTPPTIIGAAQAQTLTVLPRLDGARKRNVLQFLQAAHLIRKAKTVIELGSADLGSATLYQVDLSGANLAYVDLRNADLRNADLYEANLSGANLTGADLTETDLRNADLSFANLKDAIGIKIEELEKQYASLKGATMPDGSIHP